MHTNFPGHYNFNMWGRPHPLVSFPAHMGMRLISSRSQLLRQLSTMSLRTLPCSYFRCDFLISFPVDQQYSGGKSISHDSQILCHLVGFYCVQTPPCLSLRLQRYEWIALILWTKTHVYSLLMHICPHAHMHMSLTVEWSPGLPHAPLRQAGCLKQIFLHQQYQPFWQHLLLRSPKCHIWGRQELTPFS